MTKQKTGVVVGLSCTEIQSVKFWLPLGVCHAARHGHQLDELPFPWLPPKMYHLVSSMCAYDYVNLYVVILDCTLLENKLTNTTNTINTNTTNAQSLH